MSCSDKKNYYVQPIEECSIKAEKTLATDLKYKLSETTNKSEVFDTNTKNSYSDLNANFRDNTPDNKYIYEIKPDKKDICYKFNNDKYYENCVITTNSPLYTFDNATSRCIVDTKFIANSKNKLKISKNKISIDTSSFDPYGLYTTDPIKKEAFCQDKWYDWIVIPNYHFNNKFFKDTGPYNKKDILKCYKPCKSNYMPYLNNKGEQICIEKSIASDGIYANTIDYSPLSLINIFANTKNTLKLLYFITQHNSINKKSEYFTIKNYIDDKYYDNTINELKGILEKLIYSNDINETNNNYTNNTIDNNIFSPIIIEKFLNDNIIKNLELYNDIISSKNKNFNGNNLIIYQEMSKNNILTDENLVHTYYLAYHIHDFLFSHIFKISLSDIDKHPFNIKNILNNRKEQFKDDIKYKIIQRAANILYKAINICYDGNTDFSINLLYDTKSAFNRLYDKYFTTTKNSDQFIISLDEKFKNIKKLVQDTDEIKKTTKEYLEFIFNTYNTKQKTNDFILKLDEIKIETNKEIDIFVNKFSFSTFTKNGTDTTESVIKYYNSEKSGWTDTNLPTYNKLLVSYNHIFLYTNEGISNNISPTPNKENEESKDTKTACGTKTDLSKLIKIEDKNSSTYIAGVDDDLKLPDLTKITNIAFKLLFYLLLCYIIYLFWMMFHETILSVLNIVWYYINVIYYVIWDKRFNTKEVDIDTQLKYAKSYRDNVAKNYNKLNSNL